MSRVQAVVIGVIDGHEIADEGIIADLDPAVGDYAGAIVAIQPE